MILYNKKSYADIIWFFIPIQRQNPTTYTSLFCRVVGSENVGRISQDNMRNTQCVVEKAEQPCAPNPRNTMFLLTSPYEIPAEQHVPITANQRYSRPEKHVGGGAACACARRFPHLAQSNCWRGLMKLFVLVKVEAFPQSVRIRIRLTKKGNIIKTASLADHKKCILWYIRVSNKKNWRFRCKILEADKKKIENCKEVKWYNCSK